MFTFIPSSNTLAQMAHFALGLGIPFITVVLFNRAMVGVLGIFFFAVAKEFTFDILIEKASVGDGLTDLAFYTLGITLAVTILYFKGDIHG